MLPGFTPEPLTVTCQSCGATAQTWDFQHPDLAVACGCCPVAHDHSGVGCRPVTVTATAHLTLFQLADLMEMAAGGDRDERFEESAPPAGEAPVTP